MPRLASLAICSPAVLLAGFLIWVLADRIAHPYPSLTPDEEACLKRVVAEHAFSLELRLNEFGLPYHDSTIALEAHELFRRKPLAMLHVLRVQVAEAKSKASLRAAAIALEAGKDSYSVSLYYFWEQDFEKDSIAGSIRRDMILERIDNRIREIGAAEQATKVPVCRRDRGTLGRERQIEEKDREDELVIVDLVQTSRGKGYSMR
jgi:hypothetical protein